MAIRRRCGVAAIQESDPPMSPPTRRWSPGWFVGFGFELQCCAVDAVPKPASIGWAIGEDVAEMGIASGTADLGADHAVGAVFDFDDGIGVHRVDEARPTTAGVIFGLGGVKRIPAAPTPVEAGFVDL